MNKQLSRLSLLVKFLILSLFLFACNGIEAETITPDDVLSTTRLFDTQSPSITPEPTKTKSKNNETNISPLLEPSALPTKTLAPTPAPTLTPYPDFTDEMKQELMNWLVQAWNEEQDPVKIKAQLVADGWIRENKSLEGGQLAAPTEEFFLDVDLDGDGRNDWIVTLLTSRATCWIVNDDIYDTKVGGELWIINQDGINYELSPTIKELFWGAPVTIFSADITGDGLPDIVTKSVGCGAHTKLGMYHVISTHNGQIENIVNPFNEMDQAAEFLRTYNYQTDEDWDNFGISFPTPTEEQIEYTGDGLPDLLLHGGTFGSDGAGYVRYRTEVWSWDGTEITLVDIQSEETNERLHVLYDANFAFELGDHEAATLQYERVITDNALENRSSFFFGDGQEDYDPARIFAAFRLAVLALNENDGESAQYWQNWLIENYPETSITEAATLLLESWQETGSLQKSCEIVTEYLLVFESQNPEELYSPVTGSLSDAGYALKSIRAQDVCPLR